MMDEKGAALIKDAVDAYRNGNCVRVVSVTVEDAENMVHRARVWMRVAHADSLVVPDAWFIPMSVEEYISGFPVQLAENKPIKTVVILDAAAHGVLLAAGLEPAAHGRDLRREKALRSLAVHDLSGLTTRDIEKAVAEPGKLEATDKPTFVTAAALSPDAISEAHEVVRRYGQIKSDLDCCRGLIGQVTTREEGTLVRATLDAATFHADVAFKSRGGAKPRPGYVIKIELSMSEHVVRALRAAEAELMAELVKLTARLDELGLKVAL